METQNKKNTKEEAPFITSLNKQKTELDTGTPQAETINNLFGQINSFISVFFT